MSEPVVEQVQEEQQNLTNMDKALAAIKDKPIFQDYYDEFADEEENQDAVQQGKEEGEGQKEVGEPQEPEKDDKVSEFDTKLQKLEAKEKELAKLEGKMEAFTKSLEEFEAFKKDPYGNAEKYIDYEKWTNKILNDGKPTEDDKFSEVDSKVKELNDKLQEIERQKQESQHQKIIETIQNNIKSISSKDDYSLAREYAQFTGNPIENRAFAYMQIIAQQNEGQKVPTEQEAIEVVSNYITKVKDFWYDKFKAESSSSESNEERPKNMPQPEKPKVTNKTGVSSTPIAKRNLSMAERQRNAVKALRNIAYKDDDYDINDYF